MYMYSQLMKLHKLDKAGFTNPDVFITAGQSIRPSESCKTPDAIARAMIYRCQWFGWERVLEPCAGKGGILDELSTLQGPQVHFQEINEIKKIKLIEKFPNMMPMYGHDTLDPTGSTKLFDKIIMNPPFDQAFEFLEAAINLYLRDKTGSEIVTLFPKLSLSRLTTQADKFLKIFSFSHLAIDDTNFDCNYCARTCILHLRR